MCLKSQRCASEFLPGNTELQWREDKAVAWLAASSGHAGLLRVLKVIIFYV